MMKEIIDADKQARLRVEEKRQECIDIQNLIQKQKENIKKKYQEETKACIDGRREELKKELEQQKIQEVNAFEEAKKKLQEKYENHREDWVSEIYGRCLGL